MYTKQDADDLMLFYLTTKSRSIGASCLMLSVFDHQVISFLLDFIELNLHENDVEVFLRD